MGNAGFNDTSKLDDRVLRVPSYVKYDGENYKVTRIGKSAFESAGVGFDEVYIPDTVISIGDKAFLGKYNTQIIYRSKCIRDW